MIPASVVTQSLWLVPNTGGKCRETKKSAVPEGGRHAEPARTVALPNSVPDFPRAVLRAPALAR